MIFDRFAKCVEEFFPRLVPVLQRTKLFIFPGRAHEVLPPKLSQDRTQAIIDEFFLPFQYVAVEDTLSCVVLFDEEKEQRGLNCTRHFIEFSEMRADFEEADPEAERSFLDENPDEKLDEYKEARSKILKIHPRLAMVTHGKFTSAEIIDVDSDGNAKVQHAYHMMEGMVCEPGVGANTIESIVRGPDEMKLTIEASVQNAWVAIKEINHFNSPEFFILEESPENCEKHMKKAQKRGKIARRQHRPKYTVLRPKMIRQRMGLPATPTGIKRAPHERRAHTRTFRSDKFVHVKGKTIVIPATWIGPSTSKVGKKVYRVLLDK
jgi:hypothetical protein